MVSGGNLHTGLDSLRRYFLMVDTLALLQAGVFPLGCIAQLIHQEPLDQFPSVLVVIVGKERMHQFPREETGLDKLSSTLVIAAEILPQRASVLHLVVPW